MVLLIIIPMKNGYFIGTIPNIFRQTHLQVFAPLRCAVFAPQRRACAAPGRSEEMLLSIEERTYQEEKLVLNIHFISIIFYNLYLYISYFGSKLSRKIRKQPGIDQVSAASLIRSRGHHFKHD